MIYDSFFAIFDHFMILKASFLHAESFLKDVNLDALC